MAKRNDFVSNGKRQMHGFILKSIDDLLAVLDSKIIFPTDKYGEIMWNKLFAVVQAREQVWLSTTELMDMAEIDRSSNTSYKNKIIKGFKTTWKEMTEIVGMGIGSVPFPAFETKDDEAVNPLDRYSEDDFRQMARVSVTDDRLSSIAKAKVLAAKLSYQILNRIEQLENPEKVNEENLKNNMMTSSIIEEYAN